MTIISANTLRRVFPVDHAKVSDPSKLVVRNDLPGDCVAFKASGNLAVEGAKYGGYGGAGDLILSILTFGIYALVKSNKADEKRAVLELAMTDLHRNIESKGAAQRSVEVVTDGKLLKVSEAGCASGTSLCIEFGGELVAELEGISLVELGKRLKREVQQTQVS
ncbi:hypothetical protein [Paraburkholderia sp. RL17-373-BIF-A]|uniref:hypothetical protein n=1 Tax=Paraburkholderia sp. RL17-373-BIF-A TaxID=3031629 RepID=UPI0038B84BAF